jgi:uncharacterized protein (TIGR02001 family)
MIKQSALALAVLAGGVSAQAQEASALSVTVDVTYVSDYVFRGVQLAGASVQPSVEASYGDFYAGIWHSNAVSGTNAGFDSETDLYAGYGFAINETLSLDVGVTRYVYSGGSGNDTTEAYIGIAADVLLSPSFYYYHDFDLEISSYIASVGYSLPVDAISSSLDFSASLGYIQIPSSDYTYGSVGVSIPYALSETATLTAGVEYIYNDTAVNISGNNDGIVGSVGISIGF